MNVLLLHGALGSALTLDPLKHELKNIGIEAMSLEFPGHGSTPLGKTEFTISGYANWLRAQIANTEQLRSKPLFVFGYSMGGYIALKMEELFPGSIHSLVTLGTKFEWTVDSARAETKKLIPDVIEEKVPKFAGMLQERHSDWKEVVRSTAKLMNTIPTQCALQPEQLMSNSSTNIIIARGSLDEMVSEAESTQMAGSLHAQYREFEGMPHPIERINVAEVAAFLQKEMA